MGNKSSGKGRAPDPVDTVVTVKQYQYNDPRLMKQKPLRVKLSTGTNKLNACKEHCSTNLSWPLQWDSTSRVTCDMADIRGGLKLACNVCDGDGSTVAVAVVELKDLEKGSERDDWFQGISTHGKKVGWLRLVLSLEDPSSAQKGSGITPPASAAGSDSMAITTDDDSAKAAFKTVVGTSGATAAAVSKEITKDTLLDGKFSDLKLLGSGNFGKCYRATSNVDDQTYAIKLIPCASAKQLADIKEEARVLWRMQHRYITRYFSAFKHDNFFCVVMEFCTGGNLNDVIAKARQGQWKPDLSFPQVKIWVNQLSQALDYLAEIGLLHRDLKGDNVFLEQGNIKLADFGLAHDTSKSFLVRGQVGAFAYESPEQAGAHRYGFPNDAWALGCIITELATLKFVSERTKAQVFAQDMSAITAAVQEVASVDQTLGQICSGLLDMNQVTRMTPKQVLQALRAEMSQIGASGQQLFAGAAPSGAGVVYVTAPARGSMYAAGPPQISHPPYDGRNGW